MSRARRAKKPELGDLVSVAKLRRHGVGPRKVRDVADLIRGLTVSKAMEQLSMLHRPSAVPVVTNLLKSAVSNANQADPNKRDYETSDLIVGTIFVDSGQMAKRFRPMGQGRAGKIRKRSCHITVELYTPAGATE